MEEAQNDVHVGASPAAKRRGTDPKVKRSPWASLWRWPGEKDAVVDAGFGVAAEVFEVVGGGVGGDNAGVLGGDRRIGEDDVAGDGPANQCLGRQDEREAVRSDKPRPAGRRGGGSRSDRAGSQRRRGGLPYVGKLEQQAGLADHDLVAVRESAVAVYTDAADFDAVGAGEIVDSPVAVALTL